MKVCLSAGYGIKLDEDKTGQSLDKDLDKD
jgi:hypothetical protein